MSVNRIDETTVSYGDKLQQISNNLGDCLRRFNYVWEVVAITDEDVIISIVEDGERIDRSLRRMGSQLFERI